MVPANLKNNFPNRDITMPGALNSLAGAMARRAVYFMDIG